MGYHESELTAFEQGQRRATRWFVILAGVGITVAAIAVALALRLSLR